MMIGMDELDLGPVEAMPEGAPTLCKAADGRRFVCVRRGGDVHVLDDRCPHEGYPLSQGEVRGDVLTCCWHNWKFDLASGDCLFGGEPVRRYPAWVEAGRLRVDARLDPARERARVAASMRGALREGSLGSVMRDALRLDALQGGLDPAIEVLARDAARRAPWGFEHGLALIAEAAPWIDRAGFAALSAHVAEPLLNAPEREAAAPKEGSPGDLLEALRDERRGDAEALARHLADQPALFDEALLPWLSEDLTDYGHGAIYAFEARQLIARFPALAEDVAAALVVSLSWATRDSALPGWGATHRGVREAAAVGSAPADDAYVDEVLASERQAVEACLARLRAGVDPRDLLRLSARAAAERLRRFDPAWERRLDAPVTVLDVSHALTFTDAALALSPSPELAARFAVQSAGFVGKLRAADGEPPRPRDGGTLDAALAARDLEGALGALETPGFYEMLRPFALSSAFVRPIFAAHAVKTAEACRRLEAEDPEAAALHRAAAVTLSVPRRPERFFDRTAEVAERFLETGKPPPGLY